MPYFFQQEHVARIEQVHALGQPFVHKKTDWVLRLKRGSIACEVEEGAGGIGPIDATQRRNANAFAAELSGGLNNL